MQRKEEFETISKMNNTKGTTEMKRLTMAMIAVIAVCLAGSAFAAMAWRNDFHSRRADGEGGACVLSRLQRKCEGTPQREVWAGEQPGGRVLRARLRNDPREARARSGLADLHPLTSSEEM